MQGPPIWEFYASRALEQRAATLESASCREVRITSKRCYTPKRTMSMEPSDIKVVDAEPQSGANPSVGNSGLNPNVLLNNTLDGFASFSSKINPFAQKLGKGFGQVRQVMTENPTSRTIFAPDSKITLVPKNHISPCVNLSWFFRLKSVNLVCSRKARNCRGSY